MVELSDQGARGLGREEVTRFGTPNWFVLGVLVVGVLVMLWLSQTRRSALDQAGHVFVESDDALPAAPATASG